LETRPRPSGERRGVDEHAHRGGVAEDAPLEAKVNRRLALHIHGVVRLVRPHVHLQVERQLRRAPYAPGRRVMDPGHVSGLHLAKSGIDQRIRVDRLELLLYPIQRPPQPVGQHPERLAEPDVPERPARFLLPKRLRGNASPHLGLQRLPPLARIDNAFYVNRVHLGAHPCGHEREGVHGVARVHPRSYDHDTLLLRHAVEAIGGLGGALVGKRQLLGGRDDVHVGPGTLHQLIGDAVKERRRRVQHHVGIGSSKDFFGVVGNVDAHFWPPVPNHVGHVPAHLVGVDVDGAHERHRVGFFENGPGGRLADGTEAVLNDAEGRFGAHRIVST